METWPTEIILRAVIQHASQQCTPLGNDADWLKVGLEMIIAAQTH